MEITAVHIAHTPLGWMKFEGSFTHILRAGWVEEEDAAIGGGSHIPLWKGELDVQLTAYFEKQRKDFTLPLALGGTEFQRGIWHRLRGIPCGDTTSYQALAREFGSKDLSQAVGNAVGANPLLLLVPCHRVIGTNGSLTGYAGGLDKKQWLLEHEGALHPARQLRLF